jgi:hypothetical protein
MTTEIHGSNEVRAALTANSEITRLLNKQRQTTRSLQERSAALEKKEQQLIQAESHEAALRLLDGEETAPLNAKRRKELVAIKAEREPLPAAIALSQERERELAKKTGEIERRIAGLVFAHASALRAEAAKTIRVGLDALAPRVVPPCRTILIYRNGFCGLASVLAQQWVQPRARNTSSSLARARTGKAF